MLRFKLRAGEPCIEAERAAELERAAGPEAERAAEPERAAV